MAGYMVIWGYIAVRSAQMVHVREKALRTIHHLKDRSLEGGRR